MASLETRIRRYGLLDPRYVLLALINVSCFIWQAYKISSTKANEQIGAFVLCTASLLGCIFVALAGMHRVRLLKLYKEKDELLEMERELQNERPPPNT